MIESEARGAWRDLQTRLRPFIARRVAPPDVDDVLQEAFVRMQRGIADLRDDEKFGAWVYRVAKSAIADHRRARARHPLSDAPAVEAAWSPDEDPGESAAEELSGCIALFVSMLPSPYREAITLVDIQGMSQKQAAEMLGLSHSGMKSRVQRGRAELRRLFEQCCEIACDVRGRVIGYEPRPACPTSGGSACGPRRDSD